MRTAIPCVRFFSLFFFFSTDCRHAVIYTTRTQTHETESAVSAIKLKQLRKEKNVCSIFFFFLSSRCTFWLFLLMAGKYHSENIPAELFLFLFGLSQKKNLSDFKLTRSFPYWNMRWFHFLRLLLRKKRMI